MSSLSDIQASLNRSSLDNDYYFPVARELRGAGNIFFGALEIIVGHCMKLDSNVYLRTVVSSRHINQGTNALMVGFRQFVPGMVICYAMYSAYYWNSRDVRPT
jgi:hypothetical protein